MNALLRDAARTAHRRGAERDRRGGRRRRAGSPAPRSSSSSTAAASAARSTPTSRRRSRRLRARGGFDHLVVETTGIADPLPVAWTFERPGLREGYRVDAVATVVDALNLERLLVEAPEAALQIERADVLLASKLDLVAGGLADVARLVRPLNPVAPPAAGAARRRRRGTCCSTRSRVRARRPESGRRAHAHGQRLGDVALPHDRHRVRRAPRGIPPRAAAPGSTA